MQEMQERVCNHCGKEIRGNYATLIVRGTERSEPYCISCAMDIQALNKRNLRRSGDWASSNPVNDSYEGAEHHTLCR